MELSEPASTRVESSDFKIRSHLDLKIKIMKGEAMRRRVEKLPV